MMRIREIFRYSRPYPKPYQRIPEEIDGLPNYFSQVHLEGGNKALLDSGINPIAKVKGVDGSRRPAVLLSSSPHKAGSEETPWQDYFNPDQGYARFYGDNKSAETDPSEVQGNRAMLEQYALHSSPEKNDRMLAAPIIAFRRVKHRGRMKGNVQFLGYGILRDVRLITQIDRKTGQYFVNYEFGLTLFSLIKEHGVFSWEWINARRDPNIGAKESNQLAPGAWKKWVNEGDAAVSRSRRRVSELMVKKKDDQLPAQGTKEWKTLEVVLKHYKGRRARFELPASIIASRAMGSMGENYKLGWVTPPSSDGGADFIGRLDVGEGLAGVKLVVLGQAKCEALTKPTHGNHIARTVARLKRGWIGAYVTTSYFSDSVQREVIEDQQPIALIGGKRAAMELLDMQFERGFKTISDLLTSIDDGYSESVKDRRPEEILID